MQYFASDPGHGPEYLVNSYPWASLGKGNIVDLGGSGGHICAAIAHTFPDLNFIVQDLPEVIQARDPNRLPATVRDRIQFMPHDFMKPQPIIADLYLFRYIFHGWADGPVVKILRQLIPVLKPGARVLVNECILPEPGTASLTKERDAR